MATAAAPTRLTPQQVDALKARETSVALAAGAGCGKTFVLTERFLAELDPTDGEAPADLSELVAITFTERAAREMRDRMRRKCHERLTAAKNDAQAEYWWRLIRGLDTARVSTIHAFCGSLLRAHAVEAELDPSFRILEEMQADTLRAETIEDLLREQLAARVEVTLELVVRFGLERLRDTLQAATRQRSADDLKKWESKTADELVAIWSAFHRDRIVPMSLRQLAASECVAELLKILPEEDFSSAKAEPMRERREVLLERLAKLEASADPVADVAAIREAARVQGGGGKSFWSNDDTYSRFQTAATTLRADIDKCDGALGFDAVEAHPAAELGLKWLSLAIKVAEAYEHKKQTLAVLDFDDLIARTRRLLTAPDRAALRNRLASHITLLLVDEFQDTDPVQVELVRALCGDVAAGKLFFVGDQKQSIYRFRGADPGVFRDLQESVPAQGRLPLTLNFRSQPAILNFVNATFCEALSPGYQPLEANRKQVTPPPVVEFWWAMQDGDARAAGGKDQARRHEADLIARRLREMFDGGAPLIPMSDLDPTLRPVQPGDVVLLFRALSDVQRYEEALRNHEIDYYLVGGHAFYAQQEIFDVLNLLRAVASPSDEVSLAGVLRSPFFSLADETLFWLAQYPGGLSAGLFCGKAPAELSEDQTRRTDFARRTLVELRRAKDQMLVAELINDALARTGYDAVLLTEFLGQRKLANLRKLIEQARVLDRTGGMGLADFIVQLSQFVVEQPREALAATHPEATNVVRLMTVHQAKGLEFPVTIVVDVDRPRNITMPSAVLSDDLGPLVRPPRIGDDEPPCAGFDLHSRIASAEDEAETTRLLYVATTRAADRLILSGSIFNQRPSGPWLRLLAGRFDLATGKLQPGVKLPAGVSPPQVAVVRDLPANQTLATRRSRVDLLKLVERARHLAANGEGILPLHIGPVPVDKNARRQFSFSRLHAGRLYPQPPLEAQQASLGDEMGELNSPENQSVDPRGLGTLVHAVLADMAFEPGFDAAAAVRSRAERHVAESGDVEAAIEMLSRFATSPRAAELSTAAEVWRETEFLLAWPLDARPDQAHLLHGFIDCLYRDRAGRWHVLDYKTQPTTKSGLAAAAANYELQLLVYALAADRILGQPPASLRLYFLRPALEHEFTWDDDARRRAVELVNQAIAAQI